MNETVTTGPKTPQTVVRVLETCLEHPGKFFLNLFFPCFNTNVKFILNRLLEPIPTNNTNTTTTSTCQPRQRGKTAAPQQKKGPNSGMNRRLGFDIAFMSVTSPRRTGARDLSRASTGMSFSFSNCFLLLLLTIITHRFTMKPNDGMKKDSYQPPGFHLDSSNFARKRWGRVKY